MSNLWWLVLLLLALAAVLLALSARKRKRSGLPDAETVYADTDLWQPLPRVLLDEDLGLVGKPDYVIRTRQGSLIPVEVKTGHSPAQPYDSHRLQLAAYGRLIASNFEQSPKYGLLHYPEKDFQIEFTPQLQGELIETLARIRQIEKGRKAPARSHAVPARCASCGYRGICDQKLT